MSHFPADGKQIPMGVNVARPSQRPTERPSKTSSSQKPKTSHYTGDMASKRGETGRFDPDMGPNRPSQLASQRPAVSRAPVESSRSTLRPTVRPTEGSSRNDYNYTPGVTRAPGEGLTRAPSHRTGAVGTSILKNGETVKTREVKPSGMSRVPGSSSFPKDFSRAHGTTSKDLMRVPSTSHSRAPGTTSRELMRVPSTSHSRAPGTTSRDLMRVPSTSSRMPSKSTSGGQLLAPGGSYERSIIDASSGTVKISSFSRMEMKTSGGTTMSMSHGFSAEYPGRSRD